MQVTPMLMVVLFAGAPLAPDSRAGDARAARPFFEKNGVAFWGDPPKRNAASSAETETIWAEPMRMPDGRMTIYVPPKAVLAFLDKPTRETAKAYLAWQSERAAKLKAAIELLRDVRAEGEIRDNADPAKEMPVAPRAAMTVPQGAPILYFKKAGCGFCDREDAELNELAKSAPVPVEVVPEGDPRWKEYGVTATPSFVVTRADGRRTLVRGFMPAEQLKKLIEEASRARK